MITAIYPDKIENTCLNTAMENRIWQQRILSTIMYIGTENQGALVVSTYMFLHFTFDCTQSLFGGQHVDQI